MTEKEIIELARKTRQEQKDYFASRRYNDLHRSKELERQLDKAIEEYTAQTRSCSSTFSMTMKTRCRACEFLNWDFITGEYVPGEWFCGLHGRSRVDPDGEQRDLDHRGGCGYVFAAGMRHLRIF